MCASCDLKACMPEASWVHDPYNSNIILLPFLTLLLLSSQSLRRLARHPTSDPSNQGRTDLVHVCPTPSLRGLNNLTNLRLYDKQPKAVIKGQAKLQQILRQHGEKQQVVTEGRERKALQDAINRKTFEESYLPQVGRVS
ncbi:hypothetical protein V8E54_001529 [Elaphomyces granulatus]